MADESYEAKARSALIRSANSGAPLLSIKDALVGIGYALLHSASGARDEKIVEGDEDGFKQ